MALVGGCARGVRRGAGGRVLAGEAAMSMIFAHPEPPFTLDIEWLHLFDEWVEEFEGVANAEEHAANLFDEEFAPKLRAWWEASA